MELFTCEQCAANYPWTEYFPFVSCFSQPLCAFCAFAHTLRCGECHMPSRIDKFESERSETAPEEREMDVIPQVETSHVITEAPKIFAKHPNSYSD